MQTIGYNSLIMEFALNEEQELFRKSARDFAQKEIEPLADKLDKEHIFPIENLKKLGELGYLGMTVPEEYNGTGAGALNYAIVMEEISRACASTGTSVSVQNSLVNDIFVKSASELQKKKYLTKLATGEWIGAFGLSEAESGSDAGGMKTQAVKKGSDYVLNGSKMWITNAGFADIFMVFASTDPAAGNRGVSCFIVEKGTPGFSLGKEEDKLGIRGTSTCELHFSNCRIPAENLVGAESQGFKIALATLNGGRVGIAAQALGIAQAGLDAALAYAVERKAFGKPIAELQAIQFKLADMKTKVDAARLLTYRAGWMKDQGVDYVQEASIAKLYASEIASEVTDEAIQIHGGYGYVRDYKVERLYRDARITRIYEGTSEIQKLVIARHLLSGR